MKSLSVVKLMEIKFSLDDGIPALKSQRAQHTERRHYDAKKDALKTGSAAPDNPDINKGEMRTTANSENNYGEQGTPPRKSEKAGGNPRKFSEGSISCSRKFEEI